MRLLKFLSKSLILLICISLYVSSSLSAHEPLIIGVENIPALKIAEKVLEKACQKVDISLKFQEISGNESFYKTQIGHIDGLIYKHISGYKKEYPDIELVPIPLQTIDWYAFSKEKNFVVNSWSSLSPYSVALHGLGVPLPIGKEYKLFNDFESMFSRVDKGEYDIAVAPLIEGKRMIGYANLRSVKPIGSIEKVTLYLYLHKKYHPQFLAVSSALETLPSDTINEIYEDYIETNVDK